MTVTVVDLGIGNLASFVSALRYIGADHDFADGPEAVARASVLMLPGVGAFDAAVERLESLELRSALVARAAEGVPILGVCLGMQLLFDWSAEGRLLGLGLLAGGCDRLGSEPATKVPHVGFGTVRADRGTWLCDALGAAPDFYFTHSYAVRTAPSDCSIGQCAYDGGFVAAVDCWPLVGVQFHPEKSQSSGLAFLVAFLRRAQTTS